MIHLHDVNELVGWYMYSRFISTVTGQLMNNLENIGDDDEPLGWCVISKLVGDRDVVFLISWSFSISA